MNSVLDSPVINQDDTFTTNSTTKKAQQPFTVISWNVLHMCHEIKFAFDQSPVIARYLIKEDRSNEKKRLADIVKTISEHLTELPAVECFVCLQEVPGDALSLLREMLESHSGSMAKPLMHVHTYSRLPSLRKGQGESPYVDSSESLVTIHCGPSTSVDRVSWTPCLTDPGKGALTVMTETGLCVTNVHLPLDKTAATFLLRDMTWPTSDESFVLAGDMNRTSETLMAMIAAINLDKPSLSSLFPIATKVPSRVGVNANGTRSADWLDHSVVSSSLQSFVTPFAAVHDHIGDVSDHYPISLKFNC